MNMKLKEKDDILTFFWETAIVRTQPMKMSREPCWKSVSWATLRTETRKGMGGAFASVKKKEDHNKLQLPPQTQIQSNLVRLLPHPERSTKTRLPVEFRRRLPCTWCVASPCLWSETQQNILMRTWRTTLLYNLCTNLKDVLFFLSEQVDSNAIRVEVTGVIGCKRYDSGCRRAIQEEWRHSQENSRTPADHCCFACLKRSIENAMQSRGLKIWKRCWRSQWLTY